MNKETLVYKTWNIHYQVRILNMRSYHGQGFLDLHSHTNSIIYTIIRTSCSRLPAFSVEIHWKEVSLVFLFVVGLDDHLLDLDATVLWTVETPSTNFVRKRTLALLNMPSFSETTINWECGK